MQVEIIGGPKDGETINIPDGSSEIYFKVPLKTPIAIKRGSRRSAMITRTSVCQKVFKKNGKYFVQYPKELL